jgi:hypothetical protein
MYLDELIEIANKDKAELEQFGEIRNKHFEMAQNLQKSANFIINKINQIFTKEISRILLTKDFSTLENDQHSWEIEGTGVLIIVKIKEMATLIKMQCIYQIIIRRGGLSSSFDVIIKHKDSSFLEFSKSFLDFSTYVKTENIQNLKLLKSQLDKMSQYPKYIEKEFVKTLNYNSKNFLVTYKEISEELDNVSLMIILERMLDETHCLKQEI